MARIKNIDRNGKPIKSGCRVTFDGSKLLGPDWIEYGVMRYDRSRNRWLFVGNNGNEHAAVTDYELGHRCVFKYYEVLAHQGGVRRWIL
jgi:hypothetical protein